MLVIIGSPVVANGLIVSSLAVGSCELKSHVNFKMFSVERLSLKSS